MNSSYLAVMEDIQLNLNHSGPTKISSGLNGGLPDATHPQRYVHPESVNVTLFGQGDFEDVK